VIRAAAVVLVALALAAPAAESGALAAVGA